MKKDISSCQFKRETSSDENVSKCINRQQKHRDAKQQKYQDLEKNYMSASSKQDPERGGKALKHLGS